MAKIPEEIKEFLGQGHLAYVATSGPAGINIAPKGSLRLFDDDHLMFSDRYSGKTRQNLLQNREVAVAAVDGPNVRGYQFKCTAELIESGPILEGMNNNPKVKDGTVPPAKYAVKLTVNSIYNLGGSPADRGKKLV